MKQKVVSLLAPGREKFPRREHLTRNRDYLDIYREGKKRVGQAFVCYTVRREGQGRKLGLAVSRKVGGAVIRNRVKRYIREIYRLRRRHMVDDVWVVIVARKAAADMTYQECENAIGHLFRHGEVLSE